MGGPDLWPARRAGAFAGNDPGFVYRNLSAARSGSEPGVGREQEPQLSIESTGGIWAGHLDGISGNGKRLAQHLAAATPGPPLFPSHREFYVRWHQLPVADSDNRRGFHFVFLFNLLAAAEPENSTPPGDTHLDRHRNRLAGGQGRVRSRATSPGSQGAVRSVL